MKVIIMRPSSVRPRHPDRDASTVGTEYHHRHRGSRPTARENGTHDDDTRGRVGCDDPRLAESAAPSAAALPVGRTRRVPGLRREELAGLAGVSVDYLVRLEQGRATTPSAQVVASLARALQLTTAERDHLYRLARLVPPVDGAVPDHIPPGVHRVLSRLGDVAVAVLASTVRPCPRPDGAAVPD